MKPSTYEERLHASANHLKQLADLPRLNPSTDLGLLGVAAGAIYALQSAIRLGYEDERGQLPELNDFTDDFRAALTQLSRGEKPAQPWRGGFYFVSALLRLAALIDRLNEPKTGIIEKVWNDVNLIKHDNRAHPATALETSIDEAVTVVEMMYGRLKGRLTAR